MGLLELSWPSEEGQNRTKQSGAEKQNQQYGGLCLELTLLSASCYGKKHFSLWFKGHLSHGFYHTKLKIPNFTTILLEMPSSP